MRWCSTARVDSAGPDRLPRHRRGGPAPGRRGAEPSGRNALARAGQARRDRVRPRKLRRRLRADQRRYRLRQVQELAVSAAADIDAFYDALVPAPCTDTTPLILSVDGKGMMMRPEALREDTARAAAAKGGNAMKTRLASGEKHGRKRMATLGAVYDAEPAPRTVDDGKTTPSAARRPSAARGRRPGRSGCAAR